MELSKLLIVICYPFQEYYSIMVLKDYNLLIHHGILYIIHYAKIT